MRPGHESGVTHQADPLERQTLRHQVINRLEERLGGFLDHFSELRRQQLARCHAHIGHMTP